MRRTANRLVCAAGAVWLSTCGFFASSGQAFAQNVAPKMEPQKPVPNAALEARRKAQLDQQDAMVQQFEQQFAPQFRQLYRTELHFVRLVCQPTKQQFENISADGEPALKETIKKFAMSMRGAAMVQSDPRTPIADALAKSVRATLSAEQAARYQAELDHRAVARKRVALLNLVANIDKILLLSPEQREQLSEILEKNWNESWNQTQMLMYMGQSFPQMPDVRILAILTETQKSVWRGISKGNVRFGFNLGMVQGIELDDPVWDDRPAANIKAVEKK